MKTLGSILLLATSALAQTTPAAGTVTDIAASARILDASMNPEVAIVGTNAHAGFCALWAKQKENQDGLITNLATATDLIDDLTPTVPATREASIRQLLPIIDVYNGSAGGFHVPNFAMPWTANCTSGGGNLGGTRIGLRLRGDLNIETAGTKTFMVFSDDGYQLKIGGTPVMAYNQNRSQATDTRRVTFDQPGVYPIELTYWDQGGAALLEFYMASSALCFNAAGASGACAGTFADLSSSTQTNLVVSSFEIMSNRRVAPASWSADPNDACPGLIGVGNATCSPPAAAACGNGIVEVLSDGTTEQCDDGNTVSGDGCSSTCKVEASYTCGPPQISACVPVAPVLSTPADGALLNNGEPAFTGTGVAGMTITVLAGATAVCTVVVPASGSWSCTPAIAIPDGTYPVTATQTDSGSRTSAPSNTHTITIDTTPPTAPAILVPAQNAFVNTTTPTLSGTAEANSTVNVSIDGAQVCTTAASAAGTWSCAVPAAQALAQGAHSATATATDAAGNVSPTSPTRNFTVDSIAPTGTTLLVPSANALLNNNEPTFSGTAEAGTTVSVFVDGSGVPVCTALVASDGTWSCTPTVALADGPHNASALATDATGNASTPTPLQPFTIDTTPPAGTAVISPIINQAVGTSTPEFIGTGEFGATISVYLNGGATPVCTAVVMANDTWACVAATPLPDGMYTDTATATDIAGNTSSPTAPRPFTIDTTPPMVPTITSPAQNATLASSTVALTGTAEAGTRVTVFLDGSMTPVCTTIANAMGVWSCPNVMVADGAHTATARSTDAANNSTASMPTAFTVDTTPPAAPIIASPSEGATTGTTPTASGTAEPNSTVKVTLDGAMAPVCTVVADASGHWSCPLGTLTVGAHAITATATDAAANTSVSSPTRHFTVSTTPTAVPVIAAPPEGATTSASPTVSGTAAPGATVDVFIDGSTTPACAATADAAGNFSCVVTGPLAVGAHVVTADATDASGIASANTANRDFTVSTSAPPGPPVIAAPTAGSETNDPTPTISGTAAPGADVRVYIDGNATPACMATADASGHFSCDVSPALADGAHQVVATATTTAGTSAPSLAVPFTVDTTPPAAPVIVTPAASATTDANPIFSGTAEPGATVTVVLDGSTTADGGTAATCTAVANAAGTWTCTSSTPLTAGMHSATATGTDAAGNAGPASSATAFTVGTAQPPAAPTLTAPVANSVTNDPTPTFSGTAAPNSTVDVYLDGSTTPTCITTANASGAFTCAPTTPLSMGAHSATATATDASGTSPSSLGVPFTIDTQAPSTPVITSPIANAQTSRTPTITGTAEAGSTVTVRVDGQVVCEVVTDAMGKWTCPVTQPLAPGQHTVDASATDAAGNMSPTSATTSFTVLSAMTTPVITSPTTGATVTTTTPTFTGLADAGATVEVIVDGSVVCLTTADATGHWSCTPTTPLSNGSHTATAKSMLGSVTGTSAPVSFTVSATQLPDAPVITSPSNGTTSNTATPMFTGTAEPGSRVTVSVDGAVVCTATADSTGFWSCTPTTALSSGSHTATATATTATGTSLPSAANQFTVTLLAAPTLTSPAPGDKTSELPTFTGTALPGDTVTVVLDGATVCTATADAQGHFTCTATALVPPGMHTVVAQTSDGNSANDTFEVVKWSLAGGGLGCSSSGAASWVELFVLALFVLARKRRGLAGVAVVALTSTSAWAQSAGVPTFELERVRLNAAAQDGLLIDSADLLPEHAFRVALTFHYERDPLVLREDGARVGAVVSDRIGLHLSGAFSITDWLDVSAQLPLVLSQSGADLSADGYAPISGGVSVGTGWLGARAAILQQRRNGGPLDLSVGLSLGLPFGTPASLTRDSTVSVIPTIAAGRTLSSFLRLGASVSVLIRNAQTLTPATEVNDEVGTVVTPGLILSTLGDGLRGELSARFDIPVTHAQLGAEVDVGLRYPIANLFEVYAVGGPGFGALPGTPAFRVLAGFALAPRTPPGPRCVVGEPYVLAECPNLDLDGDGILNGADLCPEVVGIAAQHGCPDIDSDGDGILDQADACPKVPGVASQKGCPEPDTDGDGIIDAVDDCPTIKGVAEFHGCPDTDGDGIPDHLDACPDKPGLPELKGCPDPDTDGDGVVDRLDACPKDPGPPENAGCPATKKQLVIITRDHLVIKDKVYFATGKATVLQRSFLLLGQVAAILQDHPEVEHVSVEGHTDSRGSHDANVKLSQARAESVVQWLVKNGVESARLTAKGFGPDRPVETNETDKGREANRRVEFLIVGADSESSAPAP